MAEYPVRYRTALKDYLANGHETTLDYAYEFGRQAHADNSSLLDLIGTHHEALSALLKDQLATPAEVAQRVKAAGQFLAECLSPFAMDHRAAQEANVSLRRMNTLLEEETKRIARALHDEVGALLATAYLELCEAGREPAGLNEFLVQRITVCLDQVRAQLRRLSHEIHPSILDTLELVPALQFLAEGIATRTGLAVTVESCVDLDFPRPVKRAIYRVAQEALTNIFLHAQASHAHVHLWVKNGITHCVIQDNGRGFDVTALRNEPAVRGLGMIGMEERAKALNGKVEIISVCGQGTSVQISIPENRE